VIFALKMSIETLLIISTKSNNYAEHFGTSRNVMQCCITIKIKITIEIARSPVSLK